MSLTWASTNLVEKRYLLAKDDNFDYEVVVGGDSMIIVSPTTEPTTINLEAPSIAKNAAPTSRYRKTLLFFHALLGLTNRF